MSERSYRYVIIVKYVDVANQGIGTETFVWTADTLEVAVEVASEYVHENASQSHATFREGELLSVAMMTADEYAEQYEDGPISMRAEDAGYEYALETRRIVD